jgi:glycosyltransferase involved in cell wall biosynthesis
MDIVCKIDVLPILIPFNDYQQSPDARIFNRYSYKRGTNIVFVGRISPNKKQEDLLAIFSIYQKYYDHEARLFLVGSYDINDSYYQRLITYLNMLGVRNAYFTGHVKFQEVLAYYKIADIFVCMSEHEGFCVPLIEAMLFNIPIIAYDAGAIKETLGDGGILVRNKNYIEIAGLIDYLKNNQGIRARIVKNQKEQIGKKKVSVFKNRKSVFEILRTIYYSPEEIII